MEKADNVRIILSTTNNLESAKKIARDLIEGKLAACVNILPGITSIYHWQNGIEEDQEYILIIKTTLEKTDSLERRILLLHPYEVPEIISLTVDSVSNKYLAWIINSIHK